MPSRASRPGQAAHHGGLRNPQHRGGGARQPPRYGRNCHRPPYGRSRSPTCPGGHQPAPRRLPAPSSTAWPASAWLIAWHRPCCVPTANGGGRLSPDAVTEVEESLLDLVALGTVADVMPLLGENRTLVRRGLEKLNQATAPRRRGADEGLRSQPGQRGQHRHFLPPGSPSQRSRPAPHAKLAYDLLRTTDPTTAYLPRQDAGGPQPATSDAHRQGAGRGRAATGRRPCRRPAAADGEQRRFRAWHRRPGGGQAR